MGGHCRSGGQVGQVVRKVRSVGRSGSVDCFGLEGSKFRTVENVYL